MNCEARVLLNARVKTKDGVELACDVYLPPDETKSYPVILALSPYNSTCGRNEYALSWCKRGFAYVGADCRGRFKSDGECIPFINEMSDACDLLEWLASRKWCNGNVGMVGGSYVGSTQLAAAASRHPALKAAAPSAISNDFYSLYYTGGALELSFMPAWHIGCMSSRGRVPDTPPEWEKIIRMTPLSDLDEFAGIPAPSWKEIVKHDQEDEFWQTRFLKGKLKDSQAGLFIQGSWFDLIGEKVFETYNEIVASSDFNSAPNKRFTCLRVGPWGHGVNVKEGDFSFGEEALVSEDKEINFLQSILEGRTPDSAKDPARIQIFVMGDNKWRFEDEWPLKRTQWTPFYIGSCGKANTSSGDGWLSRSKVETSDCPPDTFTFDPENPVPTCGGRMVGKGGQRNQSEVENRSDVLVYTLPPLTGDMEVTGPVSMKLFVSSTAKDTDFTVKLVDVYPDGRPMNVCDGILRARFRNGTDKRPELMVPGRVYELDIYVDVTSYVFKRGHRVRIEISSSNFPHYSRNPNTGGDPATDTVMMKAVQTVYHSSECPSCIILPVIPR